MKTATIFNIQRFSLHDGPGIRTTVFLKGCPLRCAWCHNPESMDGKSEPMLNAGHCIGCELCVPVCDHELTGPLNNFGSVGHPGDQCTRCGDCVEACPTGARKIVGENWSLDSLMDELNKDNVYHNESLGGVTFSGGEPLSSSNAPFVLACLDHLSNQGIHTAVDTCGQVDTRVLLEVAQKADLVLYDLKIMDSQRHKEATGIGNQLILHNLKTILDQGVDVWVRVPLIPGYTADETNLNAIADFLANLEKTPKLFLLPYHATGRDKYPRLGRTNQMNDTQSMTPEELKSHADNFRSRGLEVSV